MRIVITGATGNLASGLIGALSGRSEVDEMVGIARHPPTPPTGDLYDRMRWISADVAADDLIPAFTGATAVVHLAWVMAGGHHDAAEQRRINILGTRRVAAAAALARVHTLVVASSIAAYTATPDRRPLDEQWPTDGLPNSNYSRQKAEVERLLDAVEVAHPELRVVRFRPAVVVSRRVGAEVSRRILGRPLTAVLRLHPPLLALPDRLHLPVVHTDDVGEAIAAALLADVRGAFNLTAGAPVNADQIARAFGARRVPVPPAPARLALALTRRLRLHPTDAEWFDLAMTMPSLDTTRAHHELHWSPRISAVEAINELAEGIRDRVGAATPVLAPPAGGRLERLVARHDRHGPVDLRSTRVDQEHQIDVTLP